MRNTTASAGPTTSGIVEAIIFWALAIGLVVLTTAMINQLDGIWALRIGLALGGVVLAGVLIGREKRRERHGLPLDRDATAFDLWTIAHTVAGMVMGAWGVPFPLVALFTIAWEIFEWLVPGFGESETLKNRVVDIAVAWVGWLIIAAVVAAVAHTAIPWILPSSESLVRNAGLHLF